MSFNSNDNTQGIHLGNYEEYFILYMDNELSKEQKTMVDDFLLAHPDLQAEFELLCNTQLPLEEIALDKEALWAHSMKLNTVEDDLLLYIDNEVTADQKKTIELELASNKDFRYQHQVLLKTKLDASETITHPNKKELYRQTERVVAFKTWMRIAAAIVLVGTMGIFYFTSNTTSSDQAALVAQGRKTAPSQTPLSTGNTTRVQPSANLPEQAGGEVALATPVITKNTETRERSGEDKGLIAMHHPAQEASVPEQTTEDAIAFTHPIERQTTTIDNAAPIEAQTASFDPSEQIINNSRVTSALAVRNTINATPSSVPKDEVASNKGSFKSFLRKATRVIGRRTGIDPTTNDGDELLIGAVALKLN